MRSRTHVFSYLDGARGKGQGRRKEEGEREREIKEKSGVKS